MKPSLLLLHGALGSRETFRHLIPLLDSFYTLYIFDFMGHGPVPFDGELTMPILSAQTGRYIHENISPAEPLTIFGYSMGGYAAALYLAESGKVVEKLVTLGTKWKWDEHIAAKESAMLKPDVMETKVPDYAKQLAHIHGESNWKQVVMNTAHLMQDLGKNQWLTDDHLKGFNIPVKLMLGDRDKMVSLEETLHVKQCIPGASFSILPATPHPLDKVQAERLIFELTHP